MNTKLVLTSSAILLGILGVLLSFLPDEILIFLDNENSQFPSFFLQISGALYLGFAMMNWMAKGAHIGGIYNRPIAIGNFMHFGIGALTLLKVVSKIDQHPIVFIILTMIYCVLAIVFAFIFFNHPSTIKTKLR